MLLLPQPTGILTSDTPCQLLVDQFCFKSFTGLRSGSLKCAPQGSSQRRFTTMGNTANINKSIRQWQKPTLGTNKHWF